MFIKMLNKTLLLTCSCVVVLLASSSATAIPKAIEIPETLREGKLLSTHRTQVNDRIAWWKKSLLSAKTDEEIQRAGEKLLGDYQLYPNPSYQKEFAEESLKQYTDVLNGTCFQTDPKDPKAQDDPLALLKRINAALILTKMDQPEMQPALQILVVDENEGLRFIAWQGYAAIRRNLFNGTEKELTPLLEAAKKASTEETNPILLSAIYRIMNLGTIEGNIDEKLRLSADAAFLQALQASWAGRCKQVQAAKGADKNLLPSLRLAVLATESIGADLKRAEPKDEQAVTRCMQMVFDLAAATAQTYDRAFQDQTANAALLDQCTDLLLACEDAMNTLADTKNTFLAEKTNRQANVPDRGAAVLEAVLVKWAEALKDKNVQESAPAK